MKFELDSERVFFTADPHWNHANIIKHCKRPFKDVEEMNEELVLRWNQRVPKDGTVFLIGDVGYGNAFELRQILNRLHGEIYLIRGNHDSPALNNACIGRFEIFNLITKERFRDSYVLSIADNDVKGGFQKIHLYHYPVVDWDCKFHGAWHLHGHSHQNIVKTELGDILYSMKIIDVGVDGHNFTPLSYQDVKEIMKTKVISK